jgi:alpha-galactosidase
MRCLQITISVLKLLWSLSQGKVFDVKVSLDIKSPFFSFQYGGRSLTELMPTAEMSEKHTADGDIQRYQFRYLLPDGLVITQHIARYIDSNAIGWVLYFENTSDCPTKILTDINDCDISIPYISSVPTPKPGYSPPDETTAVFSANGSNFQRDDFYPRKEFLLPGKPLRYSCTGGRSSQGTSPFFDVNCGKYGIICAVGWTGQWQAAFSCSETAIRVSTGIEQLAFKLLPGEKIRTSSVLLLEYEDGQADGHNAFRRLLKEHYSLIGKPGRPEEGPFCTMTWGALSTAKMLQRIDAIQKNNLGYEYFWIDAGWYGESTGECPNEFTGDWPMHTGNWRVNPTYHPDGLEAVSAAVKDGGMKLLLWVEPERVIKTTPTPQAHPEWFFKRAEDDQTWLLNLGNPEALNGTLELVTGLIEKLGLSCYRQDFNIDPLPYWRENDEPERQGINEIKHITGLYQFWDALLQRFPSLIIDNCASGGRRIDIETISRSIPLWRSDYQCIWNVEAEGAQIHNMGISWWIPYSGTGAGRIMDDTYRIRSCYSSAMMSLYWGYEAWEFSQDQPLEWVRMQNAEFKRVRRYFSCDYYPLLPPSLDDGGWAASQFHDREQGSGIVLAFRRKQSPLETARFELGGLLPGRLYRFEDADTGAVVEISSGKLAGDGFVVNIPEKRVSKLYYYSIKPCKP